MKILGTIAIVGLFIMLIAASVWWSIYKYHDCLRVGHSKTYCILDFGK